jgi:uncharacterized protein DUF1266
LRTLPSPAGRSRISCLFTNLSMLALLDKPAYYIAGLTAEKLPPAERWAIALSSMYTRINGGSDERLMPCSFFRAYQSTLMLQHSWEVNGRTGAARHEQAIKLLEWLAREGHRATLADPGDREAMQDLLAWDIARGVMVARHAHRAGYLSAAEAWAHLRPAAAAAQQAYSSWEDYGRRFLRGRLRWRTERNKTFDRAVAALLKRPISPWRRLDWQTPLVWRETHGPASS